MTSPDDLNTAIDQVAREMTAGDAHVNLRARVRDAIDRPRRFSWRPLVAAAAVAAALVVAVVLSRGRVASPIQAPARVGAEPAPLVASRADEPRPEHAPPLRSAARARTSPPRVVVNPFAEESLKEDPIVVDSIAIAPVDRPDSLVVEQLPAIEPIAVAPLGPGEER